MDDSRETMRKAFVVGYPVKHSRSPLIHDYWLKEMGIHGSYERQEVPPEQFAPFMQALLDATSGFIGGNVTIPHKEAAFKLVEHADDLAVELGAVNTVWRQQGRLLATNTDGYGFLANLDERCPGWDEVRQRAVIFGAGGASRAVIQAVRDRGFKEIHVLNRTIERARQLADRFGASIHPGPLDAAFEVMQGSDLFVNTTSLGMDGSPVPPLDFSRMRQDAVVTDIVYVPLMTPFLLAGAAQRLRVVDGLGMLLHQAVPGFEKWFGQRPKVTQELRDLVIADMAGSG